MGDEQQQALHMVLGGSAMRAPTWVEKMNDAVRDVYEQAAKQPAIRILDMLGVSDIAGVAEEMNRPNTGLRVGAMPGGPGKSLKAIGKGIKAFHGSPHDFEKFDISKIGTGEGAQAYGHGLYFAENEGVAKGYRDILQDKNFVDPEKLARVAADAAGGPLSDGSVMFKGRLWSPSDWVDAFKTGKLSGHDFGPHARTKMEDALKGRMYEVQIHADPEDFLDWDKPLSQQSEKVRQALEKFGAVEGEVHPPIGSQAYEKVVDKTDAMKRGSLPYKDRRVVASKQLLEQGIPGIKYLDQGSRASGDGTRNYVVFDDKLISIVKKYGIAAALGAGLINQVQAEQMKAQGLQ